MVVDYEMTNGYNTYYFRLQSWDMRNVSCVLFRLTS